MSKKGTKVRSAKSEVSMRIWRAPMRAASQGAFDVIPEISRSDISCIDKKFLTACKNDMQGLTEDGGRCKMRIHKM